MSSKKANNSSSEDVPSGIPRWCLKKLSLLTCEEMEDIVHMYDNISTAEHESTDNNNNNNNNKTPAVASDASTQSRDCRMHIAGLPMFLQTEALALRRHDQQYRHYIKELIELSECMAMVCGGALRPAVSSTASQVAENSQATHCAEDDALRRMSRRAEELEGRARKAAVDRVRCAQRMVLAAAVANHTKKKMKRERTQEEEEEGAPDVRRRCV